MSSKDHLDGAYFSLQFIFKVFIKGYPNEPKFSDRLGWRKSADPDQTASRAKH